MRGVLWLAVFTPACLSSGEVRYRFADPRKVALVDADTGGTLLPAGDAGYAQREVAPGISVQRGVRGELSVMCDRCSVDDPSTNGEWLLSTGRTEALDVLETPGWKTGDALSVPVRAYDEHGRRVVHGRLVTPWSNVASGPRAKPRAPPAVQLSVGGGMMVAGATMVALAAHDTSKDPGSAGILLVIFGVLMSMYGVTWVADSGALP